jgi:hypothetical protein
MLKQQRVEVKTAQHQNKPFFVKLTGMILV